MKYNRLQSLAALAWLTVAAPALAQTYDLSWYTIDGGGAMNTAGGQFTLSGTLGQPDAGPAMTGGSFVLVGGFWTAAAETPCPGARGDANCDGAVDFFDIDPFLMALFDPPAYAAAFCGGSICAADADCSGIIDFFDIDPFLACLFGACPLCP